MKKVTLNTDLVKKDLEQNKDFEINKFKTTNVNILLNRVRSDQRRTLKKRIVLSIILAGLVSLLALYFLI